MSLIAEPDDATLVARVVAARDTKAFGQLVGRHQAQVRNFLRKLTRNQDLADDLAQDCFLHAWDKLHTYSGRGSVIGWLLKVAYTTFLGSKRRANRYGEILKQMRRDAAGERHAAADSAAVTDLDRLLAVLGEDERAVLIMAYACGLSHREIGTALGLPIGTVKSVIHRSKEKIRENFDIANHRYG